MNPDGIKEPIQAVAQLSPPETHGNTAIVYNRIPKIPLLFHMQLSPSLIFKAINRRSDWPLESHIPVGFVINASSECFFALTSVPISGFFYRKVTQTQFYFLLLIIFQTGPSFKWLPGLKLQYWICSCKKQAAFKTDLENRYSKSRHAKRTEALSFAFKTRRLHIKHTPMLVTTTSMLF